MHSDITHLEVQGLFWSSSFDHLRSIVQERLYRQSYQFYIVEIFTEYYQGNKTQLSPRIVLIEDQEQDLQQFQYIPIEKEVAEAAYCEQHNLSFSLSITIV